MYIALDLNKERIQIENASSDKEYFCPICGEKLIIKAIGSKSVRTHFAHKNRKDCDDFSHDMSDWHYNWQCCFPENTREIVLENNGIKHRADILINNTVIEFQHSPISADEIRERNEFYLSCGYNMVWVFDANDKIKNEFNGSLNTLECGDFDLVWKRKNSQFIAPMPNKVNVFLEYKIDIKLNGIEYKKFDNLILLEKVHEKYIYFIRTYPYLITPNNFLKEFGIGINDVLAISEILKKSHEYNMKQKANRKQTSIIVLNQNKGRRWHL